MRSMIEKLTFSLYVFQQLLLANPGPVVMTKLYDAKFVDVVGQDNIFLTVGDAVRACNRKITLEEA